MYHQIAVSFLFVSVRLCILHFKLKLHIFDFHKLLRVLQNVIQLQSVKTGLMTKLSKFRFLLCLIMNRKVIILQI